LKSSENISRPYNGPCIVIVGPTASGKTGAAIALAKLVSGEVISADSRAIYKYMDIGTAKPSLEEQDGVPHFGIDLVEPGERFTAADFKEYALAKIAEIRARGHVPIVAGGTGLYVDALVYDYHFDGLSKDVAHGTKDANLNLNKGGKSVNKAMDFAHDRKQVGKDFKVFGIEWSSDELRERITKRAKLMFCDELYDETRFLVSKYGWDSQAMKSNIYQFADKYLKGEMSFDEALEQFILDDYHLAKRQMTWFKRNPEIIWCRQDEIVQRMLAELNN
jgi:tRNA dimethylallyltransferase